MESTGGELPPRGMSRKRPRDGSKNGNGGSSTGGAIQKARHGSKKGDYCETCGSPDNDADILLCDSKCTNAIGARSASSMCLDHSPLPCERSTPHSLPLACHLYQAAVEGFTRTA